MLNNAQALRTLLAKNGVKTRSLSATADCTTANDVVILQTVPIPITHIVHNLGIDGSSFFPMNYTNDSGFALFRCGLVFGASEVTLKDMGKWILCIHNVTCNGWEQHIPKEIPSGWHHGCWCSGSLLCQVISSHGIHCVVNVGPCPPMGRMSSTWAIFIEKWYKFSHIFFHKNSGHKVVENLF